MQEPTYSRLTSWYPSPIGAPSSQKPLQSCKSLASWIRMKLSRFAAYIPVSTYLCKLNENSNTATVSTSPGHILHAAGCQVGCLHLMK